MKKIISYILLGVVSVGFLSAAVFKFSGAKMMIDNFTRWGYPIWFMYTVATAEVAGVIGLYIPRMRRGALIGLSVIMIGAIGTHLLNGEGFAATPATILLASLLSLLFLERKIPEPIVNKK